MKLKPLAAEVSINLFFTLLKFVPHYRDPQLPVGKNTHVLLI